MDVVAFIMINQKQKQLGILFKNEVYFWHFFFASLPFLHTSKPKLSQKTFLEVS